MGEKLTNLRISYEHRGYKIEYIKDSGRACVTGVVAVKGSLRILLGWYPEHDENAAVAC